MPSLIGTSYGPPYGFKPLNPVPDFVADVHGLCPDYRIEITVDNDHATAYAMAVPLNVKVHVWDPFDNVTPEICSIVGHDVKEALTEALVHVKNRCK